MTRDELIDLLTDELKGLASDLADVDYENAIDAALRDTGWSLPQTSSFKEKWLISRSKRHLFFFLQTEAATQTRYHHFHIHQKFDHFERLITRMDEDFEKAMEDVAHEFVGVSVAQTMGTKIAAGFAYGSQTGRDLTYGDNNQVVIQPDDTV